jgi:hypothetical protein
MMKARKILLINHDHSVPRGFCCVILPGGDITGHWHAAFLKPIPVLIITSNGGLISGVIGIS